MYHSSDIWIQKDKYGSGSRLKYNGVNIGGYQQIKYTFSPRYNQYQLESLVPSKLGIIISIN